MRPPGALAHGSLGARLAGGALARSPSARPLPLRRPRRRVRHADRRARSTSRASPGSPLGVGARRPAAAGPRPGDADRARRLPAAAASALGVAVVAARRDPVRRRAGRCWRRPSGRPRSRPGRPGCRWRCRRSWCRRAAEELAFRGYLMQALAARFRSPLVWWLLPALLFGAAALEPGRARRRTPGSAVLVADGDRPRPRRRHRRGPATCRWRSACISPTTSWRCSSSRCRRRSPASRSS